MRLSSEAMRDEGSYPWSQCSPYLDNYFDVLAPANKPACVRVLLSSGRDVLPGRGPGHVCLAIRRLVRFPGRSRRRGFPAAWPLDSRHGGARLEAALTFRALFRFSFANKISGGLWNARNRYHILAPMAIFAGRK